MKNVINVEEMKRYLKRSLKKKVKITTSLIVLFMMSNSIVNGNVIMIDKGKISASTKPKVQSIPTQKSKTVALNPNSESDNTVGVDNVAEGSVAVGYGAEAKGDNSVAIGRKSNIEDGAINSIAIGREAKIFKSDQIESNSNDKETSDEDNTERSIAIGRKAKTKIYKSTAIGSEASAESALIYNPYVLEKYKAIYETFKNDITSKKEGYKFSNNDLNSLKTKYLSKIEEQKREIAEIENKIKAIDNNTEKKKTFLGRQELNDQKNELIRKKHDLNINTETLKQIFEKKFSYLNDKNLEKKQVLNQFNDEKIITQGGEGVSIGSKTKAVDQATSIGNETYAIGRSSIALGSDDNRYFTEKVTNEDKKHYFEELYKVVDPNNTTYTPNNLRQFSPTLAAGDGGIAIGTRALSYGIGATSIGAFSYALGDYSTAMGAETRAEGYGAIAVGNKTKVFSDYAVAVGNENQVSQSGGLAYGFKAVSSGRNTIAIGTDVYGNVNIDDNKGIHSEYNKINKNTSKVEDKLKNNIDERKKVHDEYDKIDETLKNLENSYTIDSSYVAKDVDKKLKYNGVEENTGKKVKEQNGNNAIVIGTNAVAKGNNSITLGHASFSMKDNSAAIGSLTYVDGKNSIGLGIGTRVFSENSLAVGIGSVIAHNSQNSLVFGNAAYVGSINSIALGNKASVTLDNSLALGNNSTTDYNPSWLNEKGYVPKGAISLPSPTNVGVISVGSIGQERRITNVAAGYRDTDAVNVSQLKSVEDKLSSVNLSGYDSSMVNFVSVDKTTADGEGKKMQDLAIRMGNYKEYIQLKSKLLEMKVRKEKNHEKINGDVEEEIKNLLNNTKYNDIKNRDKSFKEFETVINKSTEPVTKILTEIDKKKDELIKDENLKSILTPKEKEDFEKSNFYNKSTTGKDAIAIGDRAFAKGIYSVSIGHRSNSGEKVSEKVNSKEIERRLKAGESAFDKTKATESFSNSVAIGKGTQIVGESNIAIGENAISGKVTKYILKKIKVTKIQNNEKESEVETKEFTTENDLNEELKKIKGSDEFRYKVEYKGVDNAIAIGKGAKANHNDSVAIGNGSEANSSTNSSYLTNDQNNGGRTFAVGGPNVKRRITGVADGAADSDAVTVAQLKRANKIKIYGDNKAEQTFELAKKIEILGSTDTKDDGSIQTWDGKKPEDDTMITVENVKTYVKKSGDAQKIIIGIKNNPRFGTVKLGPNSEVKLEVDSGNLKLNDKKITGLANGKDNSDAVNMQQFNTLKSTVTNNTSSIANNKKEIAKKLNVDANNLSNTGKINLTNTLGTGKIEDNNSNLVKGGVVKTYVDNKLKDKLSSDDVNVTGDEYIKVTPNKNKYALSLNKDKLGANIDISNNNTITTINNELKTKADLDASNVKGTYLTNWQNVLGTGTIDDGNTGLVNGGVVKTYVDSQIKNNTNTINTTLNKKLDKDGLDIKGDDKYITVTPSEDKGKKTYTVAFDDTKLTNTISVSDFSKNKSIQDMLSKKANLDASNLKEQDIKDWQAKLGNGSVADNNTGLVNGGVVKTYVDSQIKNNTNTIDTKLDKKLDKDGLDVKGDDKYITVTPSEDKGKKTYKVAFDDTKLTDTISGSDFSKNKSIQDMLDKKADLDAGNLDDSAVTAWQNKLGGGSVAKDDTKFVKGDTVFTYVNNIKQELSTKATEDLNKKLDVDTKNITADGVTNLTNTLGTGKIEDNNSNLVKGGVVKAYVDNKLNDKLSSSDVNVTGDTYIKVAPDKNKPNHYALTLDATNLGENLDLSKNSTITNINTALDGKANLDATNVTGDNLTKWQNVLGTGTIDDGNTGLVKGGVVKAYVDNKLNDKLSSSDVNVTGDTYIKVAPDKNKPNHYALTLDATNLGENLDLSKNSTITNINTALDGKANLDATNVTGDNLTKWQNVLGTGTIDDGNTGLVKGGVVKTYVDSQIKNNTNTINTTLNKKLDKDGLDIKGDDKYITVTPSEDKGKKTYKVAFDDTKLTDTISGSDFSKNKSIQDMLDKKADLDAGNLDDSAVTAWQNKLGGGSVAKGDTKLVKGDTVFNYVDNIVNNIKQDLSNKSNTDLTKKLNVDADNLSETGKTALTNALGTGTITDNNTNLVTGGTVKKYITDEINDINTKVSGKLSSEDVDVKGDDYITVNKDVQKPNHYSLVFNKEQLATDLDLSKNSKLNEQFSKYALLDGTNLENIDLNVWQAKLGDGKIASGNTGLVKGGDIFTYVNNIKQELNNQTTQDLSNKLDKDGTNLDKDSLDKLTNKLSEESNLTTPTNRLVTDTKVSEALKGKLNADADNLSENGITNLTTKLGVGEVAENNTGLVTGGKVYEVKKELNKSISTNTQKITELDNKYTTINNQVTTNTNDIKNLQTTVDGLKNTTQDITNIKNKLGDIDKSITNINTTLDGKLDKADLSITGDKYIGVKKDNKFNYTLSFNKTNLENDLDLTNNNSINNMFTTKLGDINTNIGDLKTKVETNTNNINSLTTKVDTNTKDIDTLKQDITKKLNVDADNLTAKGETNLINKLSKDSDISKPNNKLVTDKQVNEHLKNYYNKTEVDAKVSNISNTVVEANKKSDLALGGVANAVAMANLLQANSNAKYKTNISAAYGYYGGSNALAIGFSGVSENRMVSYRVSGSVNTKGNIALGAGLGVMLGEFKTDKYPEKGKKISELEEKLKMQENEINILKKKAEKTDILEKQIQELMKLIKK